MVLSLLQYILGWFYGPEVTLQDCLAFFFSEDELKGDNMYSCEKCEKLRNGLKFSQVAFIMSQGTVKVISSNPTSNEGLIHNGTLETFTWSISSW